MLWLGYRKAGECARETGWLGNWKEKEKESEKGMTLRKLKKPEDDENTISSFIYGQSYLLSTQCGKTKTMEMLLFHEIALKYSVNLYF